MSFLLLALVSCRELGLVEGTPREQYERSLDRVSMGDKVKAIHRLRR